MFGSEVLDVLIGLSLVYLLLSLFATAVREAIESVVKARAVHLERGVRELLDDPTGTGLARWFYEHPLIYSLYQGSYTRKRTVRDSGEKVQEDFVPERRRLGGNLPTYIPARSFATVLMDLAIRGSPELPYGAHKTGPSSVEDLRAAAARLPSTQVQRALLVAIDNAAEDTARVRENLEAWFDSSMDRVSGWYKRRTHYLVFAIGAVATLALNVNTITIAQHLAVNKAARETLVRRTDALVRDSVFRATAGDSALLNRDFRRHYAALDSLQLPIGWDRAPARPPSSASAVTVMTFWFTQALGLLLTVLAITLGAPFWFDALNKMMVIRSTVKPREKSPEEGSEDRQKGKTPIVPASGTGAPSGTQVTHAAAGTTAAGAAPVMNAPAGTSAVPADEGSASEANQWAAGDPDEGVI